MTEFITRNYGNKEFEVIIKTDSKEHYKEIQDFARKLIDHAKPQTNADRIRSMSDEELAVFLDSAEKTPWSKSFVDTYCKNCPTTTCTVEGYDHQLELKECDFMDGKCPHGSEVAWWLQQPAEETDSG